MHAGRSGAAPHLCAAILVIASGAMIAGCYRAKDAIPGVAVKEDISPQPLRVGPAVVSIELADMSQRPLSHAAIMVEADMSHPGMSPVFAEAKEAAPGSYRAPIEFNMAGDWVVLLHIKFADGRQIERQMDVKGVRPN